MKFPHHIHQKERNHYGLHTVYHLSLIHIYLKPARAAIKELVKHKLVYVLGCDGKA